MQEKEVALAVVGKGEYTIHPAYGGLTVTANQRVTMTYDQQQAVLRKIHSWNIQNTSQTGVSSVTAAVSEVPNPTRVDWIPRDAPSLVADKAAVSLPSAGTYDTFVVPSKSDLKKPHIVNIYPNGRCECDNCHAYTASLSVLA